MKELKDYTSDELREELKRRRKEELANRPKHTVQYIEIEGVVTDITATRRSFVWTNFKVKTNDERVPMEYRIGNYMLKKGVFRKDEIPQVGDTVIISHRLTKTCTKFNYTWAVISKIVKRKEE